MIDIRRIDLKDEEAFREFQAVLLAEKEAGNSFIETRRVDDFVAFVTKSHRQETETDSPDWSTSTTYYAFEDGEILGKISCRWEIEKGDLLRAGGHIGYVTSPKHRRQGVVTKLLAFALQEYNQRGIDRVLITANDNNLPSRKTIEKFGGQLENIIALEEDFPNPAMAGENICRYWVKTEKERND